MADPRIRAYDQLLRDPCSANLAYPPYAGTDSGYMIRTVDTLPIGVLGVGMTVGQKVVGSAMYQITPMNYEGGIIYSGSINGTAFNAFNTGVNNNFVTNTAVVKRFRPVAACAKWIPTGPYSDRRGMVGLAYSSGQLVNSGDAGINFVNQCMDISGNGTKAHEVRWLPTAVDENFTTKAQTNTAGGTMLLALVDVDATATAANTATLNGYLEVTIVWEWIPSASNGEAMAPKAPMPYNTQQYLSTINDLGKFLFEGIRAAGKFAGMINASNQGGHRLLSGGYGQNYRRGPAQVHVEL